MDKILTPRVETGTHYFVRTVVGHGYVDSMNTFGQDFDAAIAFAQAQKGRFPNRTVQVEARTVSAPVMVTI